MKTLRLIQAIYLSNNGDRCPGHKIHIANEKGLPLCESQNTTYADRKLGNWIEVDKPKATCLLCLKRFKRGGNTL